MVVVPFSVKATLFVKKWGLWLLLLGSFLVALLLWLSSGGNTKLSSVALVVNVKDKLDEVKMQARIEELKIKQNSEVELARIDEVEKIKDGKERRQRMAEILNELHEG